jgi:hypothetical protein
LTLYQVQIRVATKFKKARQVTGGFLETPKDAAVMFDFVEEALDQMTFLVQLPIAGARLQAVRAGRNHRLSARASRTFTNASAS